MKTADIVIASDFRLTGGTSAAITAIVPTYNRAHLLGDCLDSLLAQTRPLDQIIVADDGSSDETPAILKRYWHKVSVIQQGNAGKAAALNRALAFAKCDYVWICDDDDIAEPHAASVLAGALDADEGAGFSYAPYRRFLDADGERKILPMSYWPVEHRTELFHALLERCFVCQFATLVRRRVFDNVGMFDTSLLRSQDYEMIIRIARRYRGTFAPEPVFLQRQHPGVRGAAADRFGAESSAEKWLAYDRTIFERLRDGLSQEEWVPAFAAGQSECARARAAHFKRACVAGRHAMWPEALSDFQAACGTEPEVPATAGERMLISRTLMEEEMVRLLLNKKKVVDGLAGLSRVGTVGRSIRRSIGTPLFWQIREDIKARDWRTARKRAALLSKLAGPETLAAEMARRLTGRLLG